MTVGDERPISDLAAERVPEYSWRFSVSTAPDVDPYSLLGQVPPPAPFLLRRVEIEITFGDERVFWFCGRPDEQSLEPYAFIDEERLRELVDRANADLRRESVPDVV